MKERPILFSAPMVRAILEDRKTQTRRVVHWPWKRWPKADELDNLGDMESLWVRGKKITCPYGQPGDRLWVRETWKDDYIPPEDHDAPLSCGTHCGYLYKADGEDEGPWKPSIFMPRAASRITLEVTGVRVERLQEISGEDAEAEGVQLVGGAAMWPHINRGDKMRCAFEQLWDSLNAKRGFGWEKNPWVFVVEIKRI